jgi:hypothetical protein
MCTPSQTVANLVGGKHQTQGAGSRGGKANPRFADEGHHEPQRDGNEGGAVCERGLEGVVAKWRRASYRPGLRGWIKVKNPGYWRRPSELAAMSRSCA